MSEAAADGGVRVTMRDLHVLLVDQGKQLAELATEMRLANARAEAEKTVREDHESRLRAVERRVWALPSLAAVVSVAGLCISLTKVLQ